jgi:extracellular factor (EF) 3-hydroxypalmitic acid methyl ester biosynthesis protein
MTASCEIERLLSCKNSQGLEIQATLLRLTRHLVGFEVYSPHVVLRMSEVLSEFRLMVGDRPVYAGRAVVSNVINTGSIMVCEATLEDSWVDAGLFSLLDQEDGLRAGFDRFFQQWQKSYRVLPEYKVVVSDLQTFLADLRLWLEQLELEIHSSPSADRLQLEREVVQRLGEPVLAALTHFFEKSEHITEGLEEDLKPAHRAYIKRQLHPLLLASPFLYRTFQKPLGYAGDYEMVNMIVRDPLEGASLFAKIVNLWFWRQPPAEAHRNRIGYLKRKLLEETLRIVPEGRPARVLNLGCGPACEVQRCLAESNLSDWIEFTLLDFNEETLAHARTVLTREKQKYNRNTSIRFVKKSVNQILKEGARTVEGSAQSKYDLIYCAGLFDYLSDQICQRLMSILYGWVAPGGLLVATNVHVSNPRRLTMEYVMEWNLIYRDRARMAALQPERAAADDLFISSDDTGVNVYVEVRKPSN